VDQLSGHLSDLEIEQYGATVPAPQPTTDRGGKDRRTEQIEAHLADCPTCRQRVLTSQRKHLGLAMDPPVNSHHHADGESPHPDCPSEDALRDLAAGLTTPEQASQLTQHAAQCDHCGPLLRMYTEDFSDDLSPEDQAVLAKLKSGSVAWQEKLVKQMMAESRATAAKAERATTRKPFHWRWVMAPGALASAAIIVFAIWYSNRETPEKVEKLLAQAYTRQRPIEMRFPGAAWGPMRVTLGPGDSRFSKPGELLKAEEIISRRQSADPNNVEWLNAKAQAELLDGTPEQAIATLGSGSANQRSMQLLAIAYLQQAQGSHDHQAYLRAIDILAKITRDDPRNKEAQFNLALTYTRAEMWDQAAAAWESYLRLDPEGPWAEEAKHQLDLAKEKLKTTQQGTPDPLMKASTFLDLSDSEIEFNSEQYLDVALRTWIEPAKRDALSDEYRAASRLARVMSHKHSDAWLQDFLGPPAVRDASAAHSLSAAFTANIKGHYAEAIQDSRWAARLFRHEHNSSGELRARYESVYATQRLLHGKNCVAQADAVAVAARTTSYHWLQSQIAIERAICLNFIGKLAESEAEMSSSARIAKQFRFPILALRSIGISQGLLIQRGKYDEAWEAGLRGIRSYWAGPPSVQRIYQFYVGLAFSAEHREFWPAAASLQSHALDILGKDDLIQRSAALLELAKILVAIKEDGEAERKLNEANVLFDSESQDPTSRTYRLVGKIGLAELQLKHGRAAEALSTLSPAEDLLGNTDPYFISLNYYRVLGNINLRLKQLDKSEQAYGNAIVIAERSLGGLKDEQDRRQWVRATDEAYRGMVRALIEKQNPGEALRLWQWYKSRPLQEENSLAPRVPERQLSGWPALWASMPILPLDSDATARISYAVFDDGIEIWLWAGGHLKTAWVNASRDDLEQRVRRFAQNCARSNSSLDDIHSQGQGLFALLVQPVIRDLRPGQLLAIELDRSLASLLVEVLRSPEGWYVADRYPVTYSPGWLEEERLRHPESMDSNLAILLADGTAAKGYLPGQELERDAITALFPHTVIPGPQTDLATLHGLLARSHVFGFMGHGEPNGNGTALRVSPALLLRAEDLPPQALRKLQLAVLAACATGSAEGSGDLDTRNLVHAFMAAGVPNVVASHWEVDSVATAELMKSFYTYLSQGQAPAVAMFAARKQACTARVHPYFWSGFYLVGRAD
jgi:CHAT domain-containing protein